MRVFDSEENNSIAHVLYLMQFGFSKREMRPLHVSEDL
jgi:hypothetical protein